MPNLTRLRCAAHVLDLSRPRVMGDPQRHARTPSPTAGASSIASGRSTTRAAWSATAPTSSTSAANPRGPAPMPCPRTDELARVLPIVAALAGEGVLVSIDTMKPRVMREADRRGRSRSSTTCARCAKTGALAAVAASERRGVPYAHARRAAHDANGAALRRRRQRSAGLPARAGARVRGGRYRARPHRARSGLRIRQDVDDNLLLLKRLPALVALGYPVLCGLSRKSSLGKLTGRDVGRAARGRASPPRWRRSRAVHRSCVYTTFARRSTRSRCGTRWRRRRRGNRECRQSDSVASTRSLAYNAGARLRKDVP